MLLQSCKPTLSILEVIRERVEQAAADEELRPQDKFRLILSRTLLSNISLFIFVDLFILVGQPLLALLIPEVSLHREDQAEPPLKVEAPIISLGRTLFCSRVLFYCIHLFL